MPTPRTIASHIGARGAMLLVLAALWGRLFLFPLIRDGQAGSEGDLFYYEWPLELRIFCWVGTLLLAIVAAFVPPRKDWFGWVALVIMPAQRMFAWVFSWFEHLATGEGSPRAWDMVIFYALIIAAVLCSASMRPPSMERPPLHTKETDG